MGGVQLEDGERTERTVGDGDHLLFAVAGDHPFGTDDGLLVTERVVVSFVSVSEKGRDVRC
jgi:hypothetical protein